MPAPVTPRLSVDAIVCRGGRLLLIRRGRPPFAGMWALPGGLVEVGERIEDAVVRELREETGLRGRVRRLIGVYSDPRRDPRGHTVSVVYELSAPRESPFGSDDASEAVFHPLARLPRLAFDHAVIMRDWRKRRRRSR